MIVTKFSKPLLIGISGGAASGKTEACQKIKDVLIKKSNGKVAVILSLSAFYRELSVEERSLDEKGEFDYAHPILSDVSGKGRSLELVLDTYFKYVKPAFEEFCLPTKKYADVILPRAPDNTVGVDLITEHLLQLVNEIPTSSINPAHRARNQSESCVASIRPH